MSQPLTFTFTRGLLHCPACNVEISATYQVSSADDQVSPINSIREGGPQRFELTGELTGVQIHAHDCIPKTIRSET
jgi:hypothetical protein